jgi:hypothetical protein
MTRRFTSPIEPIETIELSAQSSVQRQVYGDADSSMGERDRTAARLKALGIVSPLFKSFPCLLPGHTHQARVHPTTAGFWQYYCEGLREGRGLAEIRAFVAYGEERDLSPVECVRWKELLDFEAHLLRPVPIDMDVPEPCPDNARHVAGRMRLFVALRDARFPLSEPFVFARRFAMAYCGLSSDEIRAAINWLERAEVIKRVGMNHRAITWRLAAQTAYLTQNPNAREGGA